MSGTSNAGRGASTGVAPALLAACVLAVYVQTVDFGFVRADDLPYVVQNPHVLGGPTLENLAWAATSLERSNWHPLTWLSLMLDARIGGGGPRAFHVTNLLLHLANTLLVFLLFRRLTGTHWRSFTVGLLFAVHPLHVESVAWVAERKDLLSGLFGLLTLLAWVAWVERGGRWRYARVLLLLALGLMAKPMLVTWPCVLLLLDYWPLGRLRLARRGAQRGDGLTLSRAVLEKLPLFALAAASAALTYQAQALGGSVGTLERYGPALRLSNAVRSYVIYLGRALWPAGLALEYPYDFDPAPLAVALAAALLLALTVAATLSAARRPYLAVGWFWYLGTLVPVIGLVQVGRQSMADRYTYLPLIGLSLSAAWGAGELVRGVVRTERARRAVAAGLLAAAGLSLSVAAHRQTGYWRDSVTLFSRALAVTSGNVMAHVNLGVELHGRGDLQAAALQFRAALAVDPESIEARVDLAAVELALGRPAAAVEHYREALLRRPRDPAIRRDLALALSREGRLDEAALQFARLLELDPDDVETRVHLVLLRMRQERLDEAAALLLPGVEANPANARLRKILGQLRVRQGRIEEGLALLEASLRLDPGQPLLRQDLERLRALGGAAP